MKKTERANARLVRGFYLSMSGGDWTAGRSFLDPDIQWCEPSIPGLWFSGTHFGTDAVFKKIIEVGYDKFDDFHLRIKKVFAVGDHVVALGTFHGRGKTTGLKLDARTAHVWTLREGKAIRFQAFHDALEWQVALGVTSVQSKLMAA
jgi:ketosteroid isomerase-like protein